MKSRHRLARQGLRGRARLDLGRVVSIVAVSLAFVPGVRAQGPPVAQAGGDAGGPVVREIVALPDASGLVATPALVGGVHLSRVPLLDDAGFARALGALLGRPVGSALLQEIRTLVSERYRLLGRPYLDVGFPPQDVTDGVLQVVITEYRIGSVTVAGNSWFSDGQIRRRAGLVSGETVDQTRLDKRLVQLNAGPFLQVTPEFKAGTAAGTTDVVLRAEDHFPVRVTAGYENTGAPTTGYDRWQLGATWGNALWLGQTVNYQLSTSTNFYQNRAPVDGRAVDPAFVSHSGGWQIPLPWGHGLSFSGSYTQQVPKLGPDLGSVGLTETANVTYSVPLDGLTLWGHSFGGSQGVSLGYDYKRTNNDLSFGGVAVSRGFTEISQFSLRYDLSVPDGYGQTALQNTVVVSPGNMTAENTDASFQGNGSTQSGVLGARAKYAYDRLVLTRLTPLPRGFGLLLRATGQVSDQVLLPSEQIGLAGIDSVRGYQEGSLTATAGFVTTAEISSPTFSLSRGLLGPRFDDTAQVHAFFDYGQGFNRSPTISSPAKLHTASAGVGGNYVVGTNLTLRVEQGYQLVRQVRQGARGAFGHVSVQVAW